MPQIVLTEDQLLELVTCLSACTRSGGGGSRFNLYTNLCVGLGKEPETKDVVKAQLIAAKELPNDELRNIIRNRVD